MSDVIREFREHRRERDIKWIARDRKIDVLCHFTRIENLSGILREGLIGRRQLAQRRIPFVPIDKSRKDGCPEAVCLTISFPNYRMFYAKRDYYYRQQGVGWNQWVVLILEAKLLWELECAFCQQNAAHSSVAQIALEDRRSPEAFEQVFFDFYGIRRLDLNIPRNFPTNPQAEVLVFDTVPTRYIREVHFYDYQGWANWLKNDYTGINAKFYYGDIYFEKRKDYKVWQQ